MGSKRPMPPGGGKIADRRAKFERLSRQSPRDEEAERRGQDGDGAHGSEPDGGGEATRAQGAQTKTAASTAAMSAPCNAGRLTCFLGKSCPIPCLIAQIPCSVCQGIERERFEFVRNARATSP